MCKCKKSGKCKGRINPFIHSKRERESERTRARKPCQFLRCWLTQYQYENLKTMAVYCKLQYKDRRKDLALNSSVALKVSIVMPL
jgi:hypothetical protein